MKKLRTNPLVSKDGAPLVSLKIGDISAELSASQAEEIAEALFRAATAARYEAGMIELLAEKGESGKAEAAVAKLRAKIEQRRTARN